MPLNPDTLRTEILRLTDKERDDFVGFPVDSSGVAENWSSAGRAYFQECSIPSATIMIPDVHSIAKEAMRLRMLADLTLGGPTSLQNGFVAYAATLAASGVPGTGLITPPPSPPVLPALPPIPDPNPPALAIAKAIDAWARTGSFTPTGGMPVPWL